MTKDVVVLIGAGDIGVAIAQRVCAGRTLVLGDRDEDLLGYRARSFSDSGHYVEVQPVDITSVDSVRALADVAHSLGPVRTLIHTAGVSPVQAPVEAVLAVDLIGTAIVLDAFEAVITPGGSGLVIASMAADFFPAPPKKIQKLLATTPTPSLASLDELSADQFGSSAEAYAFAKHANRGRVAAASVPWGRRGATLNAISPGVISTVMGRAELASENGQIMRALVDGSGTGRLGTPEDIAAAGAFLLGPDASFITGTNLMVDGGVIASLMVPAE